ncbi:M28 family peptidase [Shewanella sp. AS1]|uniref:M28 family peptidase n=1 Tax=Shewanella sp. AS1 TaxID=2907626 RepID=UPI001F21C91F|nr:M28 family peptidase [Shewanella sp. AS1]MCE9679263.1 M28 family peptidase [Shewanella sp. AS1]
MDAKSHLAFNLCRHSPLLALTVISLFMLGGCASSDGPSCQEPFQLSWSNQRQLQKDVETLSSPPFEGRKTNTKGAAAAREYLIVRMLQSGLVPWQRNFDQEFEYEYQFSKHRGYNLVGMKLADNPTKKWRVIVAHYDHLGMKGSRYYPGADDNASGIAAMLAIASHANTQSMPTNLLFIATDAEEPGLFGSKALVDLLTNKTSHPTINDIELVINLDMIGHPARGNSIYLEGRRGFAQFDQLEQTLESTVGLCIRANHPPEAGKSIQRVDWLRASDHYPFYRAGVPWLYFGVPPHPDYHQMSDTADKIDMNFLAAVTETAFKLLIIDSYLLDKSKK